MARAIFELRKTLPCVISRNDKATVLEVALKYMSFIRGMVGNKYDKVIYDSLLKKIILRLIV